MSGFVSSLPDPFPPIRVEVRDPFATPYFTWAVAEPKHVPSSVWEIAERKRELGDDQPFYIERVDRWYRWDGGALRVAVPNDRP